MDKPFRNAHSARRGAVLASVLAVLAATPTPCLGLVELMEGNQPVSHFNDAAWPGLLAVVNDASRVLFASGPASETAFYQGDTTALERLLRAFAAAEVEERVVILRPGRGADDLWMDKTSFYDYRFKVNHGNWRVPVQEKTWNLIRQPHPTLTVFVGGGVDLERLRIPEGITLVGVDVLRERYRQGLLSRDKYVRGAAAHQLAKVDPYGKESATAVKRLLPDGDVRSWAEKVLATFRERAADPPDVRAKYEDEERRIREFIFAWRYGWLKVAVAVAVVATATMLVTTVVVGRARRARNAAAP